MKLISREVVFDIDKITKINLDANDVVVIQAPIGNMPKTKALDFIQLLQTRMQQIFPHNKIVVLDSNIKISIVAITP